MRIGVYLAHPCPGSFNLDQRPLLRHPPLLQAREVTG